MKDERANRKMSAILSADVKGYSSLMSTDEEGTVKALNDCREIISNRVREHRGRVVDSPGDYVLAEFVSTVEAVKCAAKIQEDLKVRNAELSEKERMEFRIGVNLGDVIEEDGRIYGDGVNISARIEGLAEAGGICISGTAFDQVKGKLSLGYKFVGKQNVKNIPDPIRAYRVLREPEHAGKVIGEHKLGKWRWIQIAAALLIVITGTLGVWNIYIGPPKIEPASAEKMAFPLPEKPSIAVLPFANVGGDPKDNYLSDGLTGQIINSISRYPRIFVISAQSSLSYKGKSVKIQQVAEELGVQYVLEGGVQTSGDKVRITTQLVDALTGRHVWSERYDGELKDIFDLQDKITIKVLNGMVAELVEGEQVNRWTKSGVTNLKALEIHYEAQGIFCRHTKEDYAKARPMFEEAIKLDPKFVWPYVYLGYLHSGSAKRGWSESREKSLQIAYDLAQKAIAIDPLHDGPHSLLGAIYQNRGQMGKALSEMEKAISLNPNAMDAHAIMGEMVGNLGRWEESAQYAKKALRLNPFPGAYPFYVLGQAYFMIGQYNESIMTFKKALNVSPNFLRGHIFLAACYSSMGRDGEAAAAVKEILDRRPKFCIESYTKQLSFENEADKDRLLSALRKAGLPEKSI